MGRAEPAGPQIPAQADDRSIAAADEILQHIFRLVGCPPHQLDEEIRWNEDPFDYDQWAISLNRHFHWRTLGQAYAGTGDEKYAREFVAQLLSWVEAMPVFIGPRWIQGPFFQDGKAPLTLDAGIRMGQTWFPAYYSFRDSPSFGVDAQFAMLRSLYDHAVHLMDERYYHGTSNWGTMEANGLLHLGVMLPEFRDASLWSETAAARLLRQFEEQVYPDGAQIELTPGYHGVTLNNMLGALELSRRTGYELPEGFEDGLERMYDYYVRIAMPNGRGPALNDSSWANARGALTRGSELFPERDDFRFIATGGEAGSAPDYTSCAMPYAGWRMMRTGWSPGDAYMLFDAGPFGSGHQHEDKLHIILHANGKTLLTEPGNYSYDASDWRRYVLSTRGHNTVLVDGMAQNRRRARETHTPWQPVDGPWLTGPDFDYAEGRYADGYGPDGDRTVTHIRKILFVKPDYWLCFDALIPADEGEHTYEAIFHLDAETAETAGEDLSVAGMSGDVGLAIVPLTTRGLTVELVEGQTDPVVQGWLPTGKHNELRPIPTAAYRTQAVGPTLMAYALIPFEGADAPSPQVELMTAPDGALVADLTWPDGRTHHVAHNPERAQLRLGPARTSAEVAFVAVNRDGQTDRVFEHWPDGAEEGTQP